MHKLFNKSKKLFFFLIYQIIKFFSFGHYFSFDYKVHLSKSKTSEESISPDNFGWNNFLFNDLEKQNITKSWKIYLIQVIVFFN